jgi:hypothetical protein
MGHWYIDYDIVKAHQKQIRKDIASCKSVPKKKMKNRKLTKGGLKR